MNIRKTRIAFCFILLFTTSLIPAMFNCGGTTHAQEIDNTVQELRTEIVEIKLGDNEVFKGQLYLPNDGENKPIATVIIFVHGTGPGTYLNKRKFGDKAFNYFDFFGRRFNEDGIAFFSYNKRGVTIGETPPYYDEVDREKFRKVVPSIESQDLAVIVDTLKTNDRLKNSKVVLLGGSEGTMIASLVAEKHPDKIDALMLFGYAHENLYDIIKWQFSGNASMIKINPVFDNDGDGTISREEYESEDDRVAKFRRREMNRAEFDTLDVTKDNRLSAEDFRALNELKYKLLLYNTEKGNEDWIWNNYFRISVPWLHEHFSLEPNKSRLTRLSIPIFIFHGKADPHVDVQGVVDLKQRFKTLGKENLKAFIFDDHDHNLNFKPWAHKDEISQGLEMIFQVAAEFNSKSHD